VSDVSVERLIAVVLALDSGGQARVRRGADLRELFLVPRLGGLLAAERNADRLQDLVIVARISAILGDRDAHHPGEVLAEAGFHERRMSRLLVSDPAVLPERLVSAARFLAAKRARCRIEPFFWFLDETRRAERTRTRAEWARAYGESMEREHRRQVA
jgi:hypothetical protein